jgi:hypothetical protein
MRIRKKHVCPCVYWGKYLTEMHNYEEIFIIFTKDDLRFTHLLNSGVFALVNKERT